VAVGLLEAVALLGQPLQRAVIVLQQDSYTYKLSL
jgi:hypothetical protein